MPETTEAIVAYTLLPLRDPSLLQCPLSGLVLLAAFVAVPLTESRGLSGLVRGAQMVDSHENARRRVAGTAAQAD